MKLPTLSQTEVPILSDAKIKDKRILLRLDTDVPLSEVRSLPAGKAGQKSEVRVIDDFRLKVAFPTINLLLEKNAEQIIILGHAGRGQSLRPVAKHLEKLLGEKVFLIASWLNGQIVNDKIVMLENLRFWEGEEENDPEFAKNLANLGDFYINESFADSHRKHASVVGLPQQFKSKSKNSVAVGLRFSEEIDNLSKVLDNPKRPVVFIIGGAKSDKAAYIDKLLDCGDVVLVGGLLPRIIKSYCRDDDKMCVVAAHLLPGGFDIDEASAINFAAIAANAGTIVWNGPLGKYEDMEYRNGTEIVARAVATNNDAFKIVGGGDTVAVLQSLGILDKMDWVSTGGGSMLEFLATGDLVGLKALRE